MPSYLNYLSELPMVLDGTVVHHDELVTLVRPLGVGVLVANVSVSRPSERTNAYVKSKDSRCVNSAIYTVMNFSQLTEV